MAHLVVTFVAARMAGTDALWIGAPLLAGAALAALAWRRPRRASAPWAGVSPLALAATVLVALVAQQQRPLYSPTRLEASVPTDLLFHAANAAELVHRMPPQDPRVAGLELPYHFFSAILPAAAGIATGVRAGTLALVVAPVVVVTWMAFALAHAGRFFGGSAGSGVAAAALVLFHADLAESLGLPRDGFLSLLRHGLYSSDSTLMGLGGLAVLAVLVGRWRAEGGGSWRLAAAMVAVTLWISGTKSSVIPPLGAGLLLAAAAAGLAHGRAEAGVYLRAAALIAAGAAPFTLWLLSRPQGFGEMFAFAPGASVLRAPAYQSLVTTFGAGTAAPALRMLAGLACLAGFLGVGPILGLARFVADRGIRRESWIVTTAASGLAVVLLVTATSQDQITFAYPGQVLLAIAGGGAVAAAIRGPRRRALAPLMALACAPLLLLAARGALEGVGSDLDAALGAPSSESERWVAGWDWVRDHTPTNAVMVTAHSALAPSVLAERRAFYTTGLFTPEGHRRRRLGLPREAFPDRVATRARAVALDAEALRAAAGIVGAGTPLLVIVDAVSVSGEPGLNQLRVSRLTGAPGATAAGTLVYESDVMRVYSVDAAR